MSAFCDGELESKPQDKSGLRGVDTLLLLLGQTSAFGRRHYEELGRGVAELWGTRKGCVCISPG